jgi:hypothetical protein
MTAFKEREKHQNYTANSRSVKELLYSSESFLDLTKYVAINKRTLPSCCSSNHNGLNRNSQSRLIPPRSNISSLTDFQLGTDCPPSYFRLLLLQYGILLLEKATGTIVFETRILLQLHNSILNHNTSRLQKPKISSPTN